MTEHDYRAFAERLFDTAKGMVDNHIFQIEYYGGFVLNANRTYYLTRSQPPLFTQEALAVLQSARQYGFDYKETLAPYLGATDPDFIGTAKLSGLDSPRGPAGGAPLLRLLDRPPSIPEAPAPTLAWSRSMTAAQSHPLYRYGTDGIGPAPEVARSTQLQNRALYKDFANYFERHPSGQSRPPVLQAGPALQRDRSRQAAAAIPTMA